jgi:hypothetical protein
MTGSAKQSIAPRGQNGLLPPSRKGASADSLPGEARAASVDGSSLSLLAMTAKSVIEPEIHLGEGMCASILAA